MMKLRLNAGRLIGSGVAALFIFLAILFVWGPPCACQTDGETDLVWVTKQPQGEEYEDVGAQIHWEHGDMILHRLYFPDGTTLWLDNCQVRYDEAVPCVDSSYQVWEVFVSHP